MLVDLQVSPWQILDPFPFLPPRSQMTSTIDPHAFAIAIELTNQLSSDGVFVDESDTDMSGDYAHISSKDVESDPALESEGVLVFRAAIPDSVSVETAEESSGVYTSDPTAMRGLNPKWWSLIEHMVDVSAEDLLAMSW